MHLAAWIWPLGHLLTTPALQDKELSATLGWWTGKVQLPRLNLHKFSSHKSSKWHFGESPEQYTNSKLVWEWDWGVGRRRGAPCLWQGVCWRVLQIIDPPSWKLLLRDVRGYSATRDNAEANLWWEAAVDRSSVEWTLVRRPRPSANKIEITIDGFCGGASGPDQAALPLGVGCRLAKCCPGLWDYAPRWHQP